MTTQTGNGKGQLVLLRHGQSVWNRDNRFTGWTDVGLSAQGVAEARWAGRQLAARGFAFDVALTSVLKRAICTLWIVLDRMDAMWLPVVRDWQLNERHYGALQGLNKAETAQRLGVEQVFRWRRSFDGRPPALALDDPRHPRFDRRYAHLSPAQRPATESLKDTLERVMPYWHGAVVPRLRAGQRVLVVAHGNSLRALVKYLDDIPDAEIPALSIPTGIPLAYELDATLRVVGRSYVGNPTLVEAAVKAAQRQARVGPKN